MNNSSERITKTSDVSRLYRLACKELVEILRDRRTIITLVLMPLLVYPLMGIVVQKLLIQTVASQDKIIYNVGFDSEEELKKFAKLYQLGESLVKQTEGEAVESKASEEDLKSQLNEALKNTSEAEVRLFVSESDPVVDLVKERMVDVGIVREGERYRLVHDKLSRFGSEAVSHVGKRMRAVNEAVVQKWSAQVPIELPANYSEEAIETEEGQPALLTFVPLMLVLMTITGAVYPAIDLTAGERERGTMEILVAAPISRFSVLIGKFVAVLVVALLTALANLLAMTVTVYS